MAAMTGRQRTRIYLEVQVGHTHLAEVLLHVRQDDLEWFHSEQRQHQQEILDMLSETILPRECGDEMEDFYERRRGRRRRPPPPPPKGRKGKRKRGKAKEVPREAKPEKPKREIRHVFGERVQVAYKVENLPSSSGATLFVPKLTPEKEGTLTSFRHLPKLSKRIVMWCYKLEQGKLTEPNPEGAGFPRPDLIPIASLFRSRPKDMDSAD